MLQYNYPFKGDNMDYRKFDNTYYIRLDKGEEIISSIEAICKKEGIASACYSGIGGCSSAEIQTFIPEKSAFETRKIEGMLELTSLLGNLIAGDTEEVHHHSHAMFAYLENGTHCVAGGHIKSITVLYTAEIELRPVTGGTIGQKPSPETGTAFWNFE